MFLWFDLPERTWETKRVERAVMLSLLGGPSGGIEYVSLDPWPKHLSDWQVEPACMSRRAFMDRFLGRVGRTG